MTASDLLLLLSIGFVQLLAVISPGPSFLITARTAVARSRLDGVKVALGLTAGTVIWSSAALLGLNAVFHAMPMLFMAMKVAGALFLLWIAWQIFRHAKDPIAMDGADATGNPFMRGFLTQLANPKVVVFFGSIFIAMLPASVPLWMTAGADCHRQLQRSVVVHGGGAVLRLRPRAQLLSPRQGLDRPHHRPLPRRARPPPPVGRARRVAFQGTRGHGLSFAHDGFRGESGPVRPTRRCRRNANTGGL